MKKYSTLLCMAVLAAVFSACAKEELPETPAVPVTETVTEAVVTEPAAPEVAAETTPAMTEAELEPVPEKEPVTPIHLYKNARTKTGKNAEGNAAARVSWDDPVLYRKDAGNYPALAAAFAAEEKAQKKRAEELLLQLMEAYGEFHAANAAFDQAADEETVTVVRADSAVVAVEYYGYNWTGGAHPSWGFAGRNYDPETGARLLFTDVVKDPVAFFAAAQEKIDLIYAEVRPDLITIRDFLEGMEYADFEEFTVTNEGVRVYFSPYSLGPYAAGAQIVEVPFAEHPEFFNEKYTETLENYVIPVSDGVPVVIDLDGDGTREQVTMEREITGDSYEKWRIRALEKELLIEDWCYSEDSFVVKTGGKYYLYVFGLSDNDWRILRVVDLAGMKLVDGEYQNPFVEPDPSEDLIHTWDGNEKGSVSCDSKACFTDPADFCMRARMDVFSTVSGFRNYHAGADGKPVSEEPLYRIPEFPVLRTKVELICDVVNENGKTTGKETLPAGTYLRAFRSDGKEFADMQAVHAGAKTYRLWRRTGENGHTVNDTDLPEEEVFEGMRYAG